MLSTRNIEFAYNPENRFRFPDIDCRKGEHLLVMGPSGCGKTTLLHLIAGLLRPDKGSVRINDVDITTLTASRLDRVRGTQIGVVFQTPHFIRSLTVAENLLLPGYLNRIKEDRKRVDELLAQLNIGAKAGAKPHELSQGELQRLSVARALVNRPSLILADEPTSSLDDENCEKAISLLRQQAEATGVTLVVITHDKRLLSIFDNTIRLQMQP